jgi:hypothetical protein
MDLSIDKKMDLSIDKKNRLMPIYLRSKKNERSFVDTVDKTVDTVHDFAVTAYHTLQDTFNRIM